VIQGELISRMVARETATPQTTPILANTSPWRTNILTSAADWLPAMGLGSKLLREVATIVTPENPAGLASAADRAEI
jgi:hypothetical protein